jgi:glycosyltransferase involved in cell wall biosynthesis
MNILSPHIADGAGPGHLQEIRIAENRNPQLGPAAPIERSPKVMFIIPGEARGSSMVFARRQAESLGAENVEVHSFYLRSRTNPFALLREIVRFRDELKRFGPDLAHAHFGNMTAAFAVVAGWELPLVITYRGSDLNPPPPGTPWRAKIRAAIAHLLSQGAALRASAIVCVSSQLRDRLWWGSCKAFVLPSGVDPEMFSPQPRDDARRALGWSPRERIILFNAGHDSRIKRLDLAQAAFACVQKHLSNVRMEVLSGGVSPSTVPLLMNAADCLLLTSDSEGSPTVVQEALACNLPVVSVPVGDTPERLADVAGTRIAPRDPESLCQALVEILRLPIRSNGRLKINEISSAHIARKLSCIYRSVGQQQTKS